MDLTQEVRGDRLRISVGMTHKALRQISGMRSQDKLIVTCRPKYAESLFDLSSGPGETNDWILDASEVAGTLF